MLDFKGKNLLTFIISLLIVFSIGFYIGGNYASKSEVKLQNEEISFLDEEVGNIKVYITGEVKQSGVYELKKGSRVMDLIKIAGGVTKDGDIRELNPARPLKDGESVAVPKKDSMETTETKDAVVNNINTFQGGKTKDGKININKATQPELMELPGIGEVKAQAIIDYREENGSFISIEDIKEVSGIGDKTFEKIKDKITVN